MSNAKGAYGASRGKMTRGTFQNPLSPPVAAKRNAAQSTMYQPPPPDSDSESGDEHADTPARLPSNLLTPETTPTNSPVTSPRGGPVAHYQSMKRPVTMPPPPPKRAHIPGQTGSSDSDDEEEEEEELASGRAIAELTEKEIDCIVRYYAHTDPADVPALIPLAFKERIGKMRVIINLLGKSQLHPQLMNKEAPPKKIIEIFERDGMRDLATEFIKWSVDKGQPPAVPPPSRSMDHAVYRAACAVGSTAFRLMMEHRCGWPPAWAEGNGPLDNAQLELLAKFRGALEAFSSKN